eukprot:9481966-Pyramimonas_sp.AAC.1
MFRGVAPTCSRQAEMASFREPDLCGGEQVDRAEEVAAGRGSLGGTPLLLSPRRVSPHHVGDDPAASTDPPSERAPGRDRIVYPRRERGADHPRVRPREGDRRDRDASS